LKNEVLDLTNKLNNNQTERDGAYNLFSLKEQEYNKRINQLKSDYAQKLEEKDKI